MHTIQSTKIAATTAIATFSHWMFNLNKEEIEETIVSKELLIPECHFINRTKPIKQDQFK